MAVGRLAFWLVTTTARPLKAANYTRTIEPRDYRVLVELDAQHAVCAQQARTLCEVERIARLQPILEMSAMGRIQLSLCVHTQTFAGAVQQALHAVRQVSPWSIREVSRDPAERPLSGRTLCVVQL